MQQNYFDGLHWKKQYSTANTLGLFNSLTPEQNGCIFKCISITISLNFVPEGQFDNVNIGLGNGLVPNRQEAITTIVGQDLWHHIDATRTQWVD